jgi:type VI secretion system protein ImpC
VNGWIEGYIGPNPHAGERIAAARPLREAKVVLEHVRECPGSATAVVYLRPWLPLEDLTYPIRMEIPITSYG